MATVLTITDGTTTINLNDGTNYQVLDTWSPVIPVREGLRTPESIALRVFSTTATDTIAKMSAIDALLVQAGRWSQGEAVAAVTLTYLPDGTALGAAVSAIVYGGRIPPIAGYINAARRLDLWIDMNVTRGDWLAASATASSGSDIEQPGIISKNFTIGKINSPYDLTVTVAKSTGSTAGTTVPLILAPTNIMVYSTESDRIAIVEAQDLGAGGSTKWASSTDAGNKATGNFVLKYTATDTTWVGAVTSVLFSAITFDTSIKRIAIYGMFKASGEDHLVQIGVGRSSADDVRVYTKPVSIDTTNYASPRPVYLGTVAVPPSGLFYDITIKAKALGASSPNLECDVLVLVDAQNTGVSGAITYDSGAGGYSGSAVATWDLIAKGNVNSQLTAEFYQAVGAANFLNNYAGNARIKTRETTTSSAGVSCLLLSPGQIGSSGEWRMTDASSSPITAQFAADHRRAYLVVP